MHYYRQFVGEVPDESDHYRSGHGLSQPAGDLSDGERVPEGAVRCEPDEGDGDDSGVSGNCRNTTIAQSRLSGSLFEMDDVSIKR